MPKTKENKQEVEKALIAGVRSAELARKYGVTPQAISLIRKELKIKGLVEPLKRGRIKNMTCKTEEPIATLEKIEDVIIEWSKKARERDEAIAEMNRIRNINAALENENKILKSEKQQRIEKQRQLDLNQLKTRIAEFHGDKNEAVG
jgi:predicted transcriptional regulator